MGRTGPRDVPGPPRGSPTCSGLGPSDHSSPVREPARRRAGYKGSTSLPATASLGGPLCRTSVAPVRPARPAEPAAPPPRALARAVALALVLGLGLPVWSASRRDPSWPSRRRGRRRSAGTVVIRGCPGGRRRRQALGVTVGHGSRHRAPRWSPPPSPTPRACTPTRDRTRVNTVSSSLPRQATRTARLRQPRDLCGDDHPVVEDFQLRGRHPSGNVTRSDGSPAPGALVEARRSRGRVRPHLRRRLLPAGARPGRDGRSASRPRSTRPSTCRRRVAGRRAGSVVLLDLQLPSPTCAAGCWLPTGPPGWPARSCAWSTSPRRHRQLQM